MKDNRSFIIFGIAALLILCTAGCGAKHGSPESVAESLVRAYVKGDEKKARDCFGRKKDTEESLQTEIDTNIRYFEAHNVRELKIKESDSISGYDEFTYVYTTYNLVLEDKQEYPCVGTYLIKKKKKKYYVVPPSEITGEMNDRASDDYAEFMKTDAYRKYAEEYDAFIKKNPGYEKEIAEKTGS